MDDPPTWKHHPILDVFHEQWLRIRGRSIGQSQRPFVRDWEALLEDAGLTSAELRREAERDVRALADAGLLQLRSDKSRPYLITGLRLPVDQESRLARLFGDIIEPKPSFDLASVDWEPELAFLRSERLTVAPDDLLAINRFLKMGGREKPLVPVKERSLTLFQNEKRLDQLLITSLFDDHRLTLTMIRAYYVPEPLGWRRGPGPSGHCLIVENAATWESFCRYNQQAGCWSAVIYGAGHRCIEGVRFLDEISNEIGVIQKIDYFGDLDAEGLRIPIFVGNRCRELRFPEPQPLEWAYHWLLEQGRPAVTERSAESSSVQWLPLSLQQPVRQLFAQSQRIAQEHLGWEMLARLRELSRFRDL